MFRIRRIYDEVLPVNRDALAQVKKILRERFAKVSAEEIEQLGEKLHNAFKQRFRTIVFVAENERNRVLGFAVLMHEPIINFTFLDWIATARGKASGGIGGALYERIRQESLALGAKGLFFECLPDDPALCPSSEQLKENRLRLRFYERYGARPIINTDYETPVQPDETCFPYLVYDGLGKQDAPDRRFARKVVRAILKRKYAGYCPEDYIEKVVSSFADDPVRLRSYRHVKSETIDTKVNARDTEPIALVVNDRHGVHHIHERGYVESPVRIRSILAGLEASGLFEKVDAEEFSERHLAAVHDADFVQFIRKSCEETPEGKSIYPYVFPIRNKTRPPRERSVLSGYYCIDTFTPINRNAYTAARRATDCALTAARQIIGGRRIAYALVRPPGHHAERRAFGGFCYFNNNAVAAHYLSQYGRVAILDIDYHHGNGQQDIFYRRQDVLTVSIHGAPSFAYPYFSGFREETGEDSGKGFNLNLPLPESVNGKIYRKYLARALHRIEEFNPSFLVLALGFDTSKGDPTGTWNLTPEDFERNGRMIGELGLPTVVTQEGGYRTRSLGIQAKKFFQGLTVASLFAASDLKPDRVRGIRLRHDVLAQDPEKIAQLVAATGFFTPTEIGVAVELVREYLSKGAESGYQFLFAEHSNRLAGYSCYGQAPMTVSSWDLYWIAVHPEFQAKKLGRSLLKETENKIRKQGGKRLFVETSMKPQYHSTRVFYEHNGFKLESLLEDYYAPGDAKAIYSKTL